MLQTPEITKNLGNISFNIPVTITYPIVNDTDEPITVDSIGASCGCSSPKLTLNPVPPHTTGAFEVLYSANSQGNQHKSAWIKVGNNVTTFYFSANVQ